MDDKSMPATEMELLLEEVRGLRADLQARDQVHLDILSKMEDMNSLLEKMDAGTRVLDKEGLKIATKTYFKGLHSGVTTLLALGVAAISFMCSAFYGSSAAVFGGGIIFGIILFGGYAFWKNEKKIDPELERIDNL